VAPAPVGAAWPSAGDVRMPQHSQRGGRTCYAEARGRVIEGEHRAELDRGARAGGAAAERRHVAAVGAATTEGREDWWAQDGWRSQRGVAGGGSTRGVRARGGSAVRWRLHRAHRLVARPLGAPVHANGEGPE
jgi:hypothetical protein